MNIELFDKLTRSLLTPLTLVNDTAGENNLYSAEGLTVEHRNMHFINDNKFMTAFNQNVGHEFDRKNLWRTHVFSWAFKRGLGLDGDLVELGVHYGFKSAVAADYTNFENYPNKNLWLYDTWSGVPDDKWNKDYFGNERYSNPKPFNIVTQRFAKYPNVKIVRGSVPEILIEAIPERISFMHIDMNSAISEIGALDALFDRLTTGAVCLFDDFGLRMFHENCKSSLDWLTARGYYPMELPTCQAIVIK